MKIFRKIFVFALLIFALLSVSAQKCHQKNNSADKKVCFGLYFGPTIDWFAPTTKALERDVAKVGFLGGVTVDVGVTQNKIIYVSTGLLVRYLQAGLAFTTQYPIFDSLLVTPTVRTYQTFYLTIPTGVKFKTNIANRCAFLGKVGLYHNFKLGGMQFDNFKLDHRFSSDQYLVATQKDKNQDAALFAESGYLGFGFEFLFDNNTGIAVNADYCCQFNYFKAKAKNTYTNERFKTVVHSLNITVGFVF